MPDLSGNLDIDLERTNAGLRVCIRSSRPLTAARVFAGKPVLDVARRLPMLFSICSTAQSKACAEACEQALGLRAPASVRAQRANLLRAETLKEHLWRLLLDWPQALGLTPVHAPVAAAMRAFLALRAERGTDADPFLPGAGPRALATASRQAPGETLAAIAAEQVFGMPPRRWLEQVDRRGAFVTWAGTAKTVASELIGEVRRRQLAGLGRSAIAPLPDSPPPELSLALSGADADAFVAAPSWRGKAHETTPFARCRQHSLVADLATEHGNGLLPRLAALLLELAQTAVMYEQEAAVGPGTGPVFGASGAQDASGPHGIGIGHAQAARGLLVHRVEVLDGRVASYRILAPTEWNFHPRGVVATGLADSGLARLADDAELKRRAILYVTAIDPCVGYALSVS